ncbi:hypothetical protein V1502_09395 [Bacillus sp. SCS-153A]|uniref:hypothetical protein n=1 Tax=Rossellomorea sedimentorum TaxID=3115294 RepID=UPI0039057CAE
MANIVLTQYFILTWLLSGVLYYLPKKVLFIEAAFVFMVQSILLRSHFSILSLNLGYIELPTEKHLFIAFILYRSSILPLFFILLLNITLMAKKKTGKSAILAGGAVFLLLLEWISNKAELIGYNEWNLVLQTGTNLLFFISTFISFHIIRRLMKRVCV